MKRNLALFLTLLLAPAAPAADAASPSPDATNRIAGGVSEGRSGARDVVVILCDQRTGVPLSADTMRPVTEKEQIDYPPKLITTSTDNRGEFVFDHLPEGEYRVVAQKWTGPFKGVVELHGTVIQLFGTADHIRVPSAEAVQVTLKAPGDGILVFDQKAPNDSTILFLSTEPPVADPILGLHALGREFLTHTIGINVMPGGRTTVIGAPRGTVHAFFFAPDNSPGYAADSYEVGDFTRAPTIPFVAGWSDGRHDPPPRLQRMAELLQQNQWHAESVLGLRTNVTRSELAVDYRKLLEKLDQKVELPGGEQATVGDLLAIISYARMKAGR